MAKTRFHAINLFGNIVIHRCAEKIFSLKIPQKLLEIACHDSHFNVQERALNSLKLFCKHEKAKKVIYKNK